jgi:hypothetical protein
MLNWPRAHDLLGETAREMGLLIVVFAPLDAIFADAPVNQVVLATMISSDYCWSAAVSSLRRGNDIMTEHEYIIRWSYPIAAGFILLLCALAIDFFILRHERKRHR